MTESHDENGARRPHRIRRGPLQGPVFGNLPPAGKYVKETPAIAKRYEERHFSVIRQHPGQWAMVATFKIGSVNVWGGNSRKKTNLAVRYEQQMVIAYFRQHKPLERWKVSTRTTAETWGDRELWVRYDGEWTEEERQADEAARKERYRWRQEMIKKSKAEKEARAKAQILEMQSQRGKARRG